MSRSSVTAAVAVARPELPPFISSRSSTTTTATTTISACPLQDVSRGEDDGAAAKGGDTGCCPCSLEGFSTAMVDWLFNANAVTEIEDELFDLDFPQAAAALAAAELSTLARQAAESAKHPSTKKERRRRVRRRRRQQSKEESKEKESGAKSGGKSGIKSSSTASSSSRSSIAT